MRNNQKAAVVGSHATNVQQAVVSASPTTTDGSRKAIEQVMAMEKTRAVWTLLAKVK